MERNLMVAGFGGQGVMTLGKFLAEAACDATDKNVTFFPSYGAEQRGGTANCYVVISDDDIGAPLGDSMDDLIVMNDPSLQKFLYKLLPGGTLFINSSIVKSEITRTDIKVVSAPVTEIALDLGNARCMNVVLFGAMCDSLGCPQIDWEQVVADTVPEKVRELNIRAFRAGREAAQRCR